MQYLKTGICSIRKLLILNDCKILFQAVSLHSQNKPPKLIKIENGNQIVKPYIGIYCRNKPPFRTSPKQAMVSGKVFSTSNEIMDFATVQVKGLLSEHAPTKENLSSESRCGKTYIGV